MTTGLFWPLLNVCDNLRELQVYTDLQGPFAELERQPRGSYHVVISKTWAAASPTVPFWQPRFRGKTCSLGQSRCAGQDCVASRTCAPLSAKDSRFLQNTTPRGLVWSLSTEPAWTALLSSGQHREKEYEGTRRSFCAGPRLVYIFIFFFFLCLNCLRGNMTVSKKCQDLHV